MTELSQPLQAFIVQLLERASANDKNRPGNRADRAALARGLGKAPGAVPAMYRALPALASVGRYAEDDCFLIASLFARHPVNLPGNPRETNLGASFARIRDDRRSGSEERRSESVERRFVALLACDRDDLPEHLRQAISLLRAKEIPVNWAALLGDVRRWDQENRLTQRSWASGFWGQPTPAGSADTSDDESDARIDESGE